jgi:voltage-gated potassium channel Kch
LPDPDERPSPDSTLAAHYAIALGLLIVTILTFAVGTSGWARLLSVTIEGFTLCFLLWASGVRPRVLRVASAVAAVAIVSAAASIVVGGHSGKWGPAVIGALLALVAPIAIVRRLTQQHYIDAAMVAGALCIYLLAGLFFAYVYGAVDAVQGDPFFAQTADASSVEYVYFSFITLATVGYGDLTARGDLGRLLAVSEALLGQLYLVSAVALLVSNLGEARPRRRTPTDDADT